VAQNDIEAARARAGAPAERAGSRDAWAQEPGVRTQQSGVPVVKLEEARRRCMSLARRHGENFTVLSLLAPRHLRTHLAVVYAYCRAVDDLGDEGRLPRELEPNGSLKPSAHGAPRASRPELHLGGNLKRSAPSLVAPRAGLKRSVPPAAAPRARLALLDALEGELELAWEGRPESPLFVALAATAHEFGLPQEPFRRLIEANRMDQRTTRYATYPDLVDYCEHSAMSVGRIVLDLYRVQDKGSARLSDATCTALQLVNFCQDVKRDFAMGRVYLPQEDLARFGVAEADLAADMGSESFRRLMQFEVERARALFAGGSPLVDRVSGHLRVDLALFSRGGLAILDKIEKQNYDTLAHRPSLSRVEKARIFLLALAACGQGRGQGRGKNHPSARET
jgi:squalene synthase HpnC